MINIKHETDLGLCIKCLLFGDKYSFMIKESDIKSECKSICMRTPCNTQNLTQNAPKLVQSSGDNGDLKFQLHLHFAHELSAHIDNLKKVLLADPLTATINELDAIDNWMQERLPVSTMYYRIKYYHLCIKYGILKGDTQTRLAQLINDAFINGFFLDSQHAHRKYIQSILHDNQWKTKYYQMLSQCQLIFYSYLFFWGWLMTKFVTNAGKIYVAIY